MIYRNLFSLPLVKAVLLAALISSGDSLFAEEKPFLPDKFNATASIDFGHIVNGEYYSDELSFYPLNRNMVQLKQGAAYGDYWQFSVGLMGIIWWPFSVMGVEPHERTIRVQPGVTEARAKLNFSTHENSSFIEFGYIPYRYNYDAANLGEYLYRSGTYPGYIVTTDGFRLINHTAYEAYGAHVQWVLLDGGLKQNFNLFMETATVPVGDISPAYDLSFRFSIFELGAGIFYNRFLSYAPSKLQKKELNNAYIETDTSGVDTALFRGPFEALPGVISRKIERGDSSVPYKVLHYWTQKGIKVMGRLAVDLGFIIPEGFRNPGDLRIFSEIAVLGLENQPYYYNERSQRTPFMFGINIPTFRILDVFSVQMEYYASPYTNNKTFIENAKPVWVADFNSHEPEQHRDDWKWSINIRKKLNEIITVNAQIANDHFRLPQFNSAVGDKDLTLNPKQGYYVLRLEMGW